MYIGVSPVIPQSDQHQHFMVKQSVISLKCPGCLEEARALVSVEFPSIHPILLPAIPNMWNNTDRISANTKTFMFLMAFLSDSLDYYVIFSYIVYQLCYHIIKMEYIHAYIHCNHVAYTDVLKIYRFN